MFLQGLSGLNAAAESLTVIGKNIANSSTVGFKESSVNFSEVMSSSMGSSTSGASLTTGAGTLASQLRQLFTQGNLAGSTNPLDVAINGSGFYRLADSNTGAVSYTRDGQFQLDSTGNIITANGQQLTGYAATNNAISSSIPAPLNVSNTAMLAQVTSTVTANLNLDATSSAPATATFSASDPTSYNFATPVQAFDKQGASQNVQLYFVSTATAGSPTNNTWKVYSTTTPSSSTSSTTTPTSTSLGTVTFDATGKLLSPSPASFAAVPVDATGDTATIDISSMTQYASQSYTTSMTQNGFASGMLTSFKINSDGKVIGSYSNNQTSTLGQVALANFRNPNGLQPTGENSWLESAASGSAAVGVPGSGNFGVLQASATESSNVDLTANMIGLLAAQRAYQANAQTIKAEDQIAQTMVNLG